MVHEFRLQRRVEFAETDMAGIVHFSNYFRYMEACEHEFFRSLGLVLHWQANGEMQGFARVNAACEYRSPLHYADRFEMHLSVIEKRSSSLTYRVTFTRLPDEGTAGSEGENPEQGRKQEPRETASGTMTVVCVRGLPGVEPMRAVPLPDEIAARLEVDPRVSSA